MSQLKSLLTILLIDYQFIDIWKHYEYKFTRNFLKKISKNQTNIKQNKQVI